MSLRVWLPLNGDLRNNGLDNIEVVNDGATVDNNGKIGKCYYLSGNANSYINTNYSTNIGISDFSISLWVKIPTITSGSYYTVCTSKSASAASSGFGIYWNYSQKKFLWSTADGTNATEIWMAVTVDSIVYDKWIHLVMVRNNSDEKKGYFYINGERYELASIPAIRNITIDTKLLLGKCSNGSYPIKAYYNDFRIYDHALSAKEVKELSKGLVCYYKLDGNGSGDNILAGTSNTEVQYEYPESSYKDRWSKKTSIIPTASQYTLSFYAKSTVNGDKVRAHFYSPNTTTKAETNQGVTSTASDGNIDFTLSTRWERYWVVWTQTAADATKSVIFPRMFSQASGQATGTGIVSIKCVKLEEGNVATAWKPNSSDSSYSSFDNTIYDSSGNNYNMITNGNPTYQSYSPKNLICTNFVSPSNAYCTKFSPTGYSDNYTVSFWAIYKANNTMAFGHTNGNRLNLFFASSKIYWNTGDSYNNPFQNNGTDISNSAYMNSWHHYVITADGTSNKLYIDGEYAGTAKTFRPLTGTTLVLSGWSTDTSVSYRLGDKISDFRLYSTTLSEQDIKELYNTGASIDKGNNLHTYELLESGSNELLDVPYTNWYSQHNDIPSNWYKNINNGEVYFESTTVGSHAAGSRYIPINPTNKTYYYDFCISVSAGNRFYIGFERYDKDKTPRSNNACVYVFGSAPSSDLVKARYKGTVNLSTDGVNPCAFIALRILNRWSGSTSETEGKATIHYLSLREVNNATGFETTKLFKTGVFKADDFFEKNDKSNIEKDGIINMPNQFIEI